MSRFALLTVAAVVLAGALGLLAEAPARWWAVGLVAAAYVASVALGVAWMRLGLFASALCHGERSARLVALTFDDGPDPQATPPLLDMLRDRGVPAAFLCVGEKAAEHPGIVRRMAAEGHAVGNHTFHHGWRTNFLFGRHLRAELARAQDTLLGITGVAPAYFRPPRASPIRTWGPR